MHGHERGRRTLGIALALVVLVTSAESAALIGYDCHDRVVTSEPTGRFRLVKTFRVFPRTRCIREEAESQFCVTLLDMTQAKPRWSLLSPERKQLQGNLFVHDSGWVVVWMGSEVVGLRPKDGAEAFRVDLTRGLPEGVRVPIVYADGRDPSSFHPPANIRRTYFAEIESRKYFVFRGDKPIPFYVIDLEAGRLLRDLPGAPLAAELVTGLLGDERRWIQGTLRDATKRLSSTPDDQWLDAHVELLKAIQSSVERDVREVLPDLKWLERYNNYWERFGGAGCAATDGVVLNDSSVNPIRQAAQWAIRRLGDTPAGASALALRDGLGQNVSNPLPGVQSRKPESVRNGMAPSEILPFMGNPDVVGSCSDGPGSGVQCSDSQTSQHLYWDFFLDRPESETMRIWWGPGGTVASTERRIPAWKAANVLLFESDCTPSEPPRDGR